MPDPRLTVPQRDLLATVLRLQAAGEAHVVLSDVRSAMGGLPSEQELSRIAYQLHDLGLLRKVRPTVEPAPGAADALPAHLRPGKATPEPAAPSPAAIQPPRETLWHRIRADLLAHPDSTSGEIAGRVGTSSGRVGAVLANVESGRRGRGDSVTGDRSYAPIRWRLGVAPEAPAPAEPPAAPAVDSVPAGYPVDSAKPAADRVSDHRGAALVDLTAALGLATGSATWDDAIARVRELTDDLVGARKAVKCADEDAAACRAALSEIGSITHDIDTTLDSVGAPAGASVRARILALVAARDLREQTQADLSAAALARERMSAGVAELRAAELAAVLSADPAATWPALVERVRRLCWSIAGARAALGGAA